MTRRTTLKTKSDFYHQGAVRVEQPFQMTVSRGCIGYYRFFLPRQLINGLEDLKRFMIMRGMIPLIAGLVDSKRLPKVAVAALSALSWFVLRFLFFCNTPTSHFQTVEFNLASQLVDFQIDCH